MNDFPQKRPSLERSDSADPYAARVMFQIRNLRIAYAGRPALSVESLAIRPRRITAIIGPSGCGKTSFLQCLNRLSDLVPRCSVAGNLTFQQGDLLDPRLDVTAHRRQVGMIFQKPNPFPLSIYRNLELPLREHGLRDRRLLRESIEKSLLHVGLWDEVKNRLDASALSLSGGQQQRLCIARALALGPQVLLMDEPCSALDPLASGVVEDLIVSLRDRVTVVIVTHNLAQARRVADDAAVFWLEEECGRLLESGSAEKIFSDPDHATTAAYIRGVRG